MQQTLIPGISPAENPSILKQIGRLKELSPPEIIDSLNDEETHEAATQTLLSIALASQTSPKERQAALEALRGENMGVDLVLRQEEHERTRKLTRDQMIQKVFNI